MRCGGQSTGPGVRNSSSWNYFVAATSLFASVYVASPQLCWIPYLYYKSSPPESWFH